MAEDQRVTACIALPHFTIELCAQRDWLGGRRVHCLPEPSLVYMCHAPGEPSRGCFGEPRSHRSFLPLGAAIFMPADLALHVLSPALQLREMLVLRFDADFYCSRMEGSRTLTKRELAACSNVRAPALLQTLRLLAQEIRRDDMARDTVAEGLGLVALGELARHFERIRRDGHASGGALSPWQLRRIEERLALPGVPPPNVPELAALCGIGTRHLMRAFKATTGETVKDHVERKIFERAAELLTACDMPMKLVAAELGYSRQGSFSTAFRRRFGTSPRTFTAQQRAARPTG